MGTEDAEKPKRTWKKLNAPFSAFAAFAAFSDVVTLDRIWKELGRAGDSSGVAMDKKPNPHDGKPGAVRRLYEVFAHYLARPTAPECEFAYEVDDLVRLYSIPVTDLSGSDLKYYVQHAMLTVGDSVDYKHFLPRVFEVMLCEDGSVDPEIVVGKLSYADWRRWPRQEQEAIEAFLDFWWSDLLTHFPASHDADTCLCSVALAINDISPYMELWQHDWGPPAIRHLADLFITCGHYLLTTDDAFSPWWHDRPVAATCYRDWLLSDATRAKLESAFFRFAEEPYAEEISEAVRWFDMATHARQRRASPP
jgi:hypothetical protein